MINENKPHLIAPVRTITASVSVYDTDNKLIISTTGNGDVKSITIDRVGENSKCFGFGISQKATITLLDRLRAYKLQVGYRVVVMFDDTQTAPEFYIDTVARNENTNEITFTAFDKLADAAKHTVSEINYNIGSYAALIRECAGFLGLYDYIPEKAAFSKLYENANFSGKETLRELLDDVAEATQSVYFVNAHNDLQFYCPSLQDSAVFTIDKALYFTLESKPPVALAKIATITDLGDNVAAGWQGAHSTSAQLATQNVYNNAFWTLDNSIATTLGDAIDAIGGVVYTPFNCSWRGNYLLEPMDMIEIITKDGNSIFTYLVNDTITYNGGFAQVSKWEYSESEKQHTNPSTLGDVLKDTYARVDKANQQIELVASKADGNSAEIATLQLNTDSINATVEGVQKELNESISTINGELATLTEKASLQLTPEDVRVEIQQSLDNGVSKVETTTGFTFNEDGLTVSKTNSEISTTITEDGMAVNKSGNAVLTANSEGVKAVDLHATTYLIIGNNSRLEDYGSRTACFWIGG